MRILTDDEAKEHKQSRFLHKPFIDAIDALPQGKVLKIEATELPDNIRNTKNLGASFRLYGRWPDRRTHSRFTPEGWFIWWEPRIAP